MNPRNAISDHSKRTYTVPGSTEPLTSVTTFLQAYPKEYLVPWAAKMTAQRAIGHFPELVRRMWDDGHEDAERWLKAAPQEKRETAAGHGTDVHAYLEARATEDQDYDYLPETPATVAVEQFLAAFRPEPLYVEAQIASIEYGYAGSLDLIASVYGRTGLIDLKTSGTVGAETRLQLAAYRHGEFIFEDERVIAAVPKVDFCAVLWIPRDNPAGWQFIEVDADLPEFVQFQHIQATWHFSRANKSGVGGTLILTQKEANA